MATANANWHYANASERAIVGRSRTGRNRLFDKLVPGRIPLEAVVTPSALTTYNLRTAGVCVGDNNNNTRERSPTRPLRSRGERVSQLRYRESRLARQFVPTTTRRKHSEDRERASAELTLENVVLQ